MVLIILKRYKEKYYTPESWEFHIGFEYERKVETGDLEDIWVSRIFPEDGLCTGTIDKPELVELYYNNFTKEDTRVKHLDQEDVESLGFKYVKQGCSEDSKIFRNNVGAGIEIYFREDGSMLISHETRRTSVLFEGTVKNKSEFSRLLRQLGIK